MKLYKFISISILIFLIPRILTATENNNSSSKQDLHGFIEYKIVDLKTNKIINCDKLVIERIHIEKTNIRSEPDQIYFEDRYLKLNDNFIIGLNNYGYKNKEAICGFGMWFDKINMSTFSWEWYNQIGENRYKKIQGNGELLVEYKKRSEYWVISKITFIGNQTFRCKKQTAWRMFLMLLNRNFALKEDWHCVISDGSYIELQ